MNYLRLVSLIKLVFNKCVLHEWMDGWMGGWMDGWMDGWMEELK
jgi:hypothetical protein